MRQIAFIGRDNMLIGRIRAAAADIAQVVVLPTSPAEFRPELARVKPALVLLELSGSGAMAALPQLIAAIADAATSAQVVVIGDAGNAGDVLAAVRAGSSDFVDSEEPVASLAGHIKRRFTESVEVERREPTAFSVVIGAQPGSGAGLFALNLALVRASTRREALLIDCQLPATEAGAALDIPIPYSLADAVRDSGRLDRTLLLSAIAHHEASGLRVLPLSLRSTDDITVSPERLVEALRLIRPLFEETVLNAGGIRQPALLSALAQWASTIYLVCPQKFTALRDAKDLLSALPVGFDTGKIVLIVDSYSPRITLTPEQMRASVQLDRMVVLPEARDDLINGVNIGKPFVLAKPRAAYSLAIQTAAEGEAPAPAPRLRTLASPLGRLRRSKAR